MNSNHTAHDLLLVDALNHIPRLEVHQDRVTRILNTVVLPLDLAECALKPIPLRLILLAALGNCDGVFKRGVVAPESELLEGGAAGEEVEDWTDNGLLFWGERYAGGGGDVGVLDVERGGGGLVGDSCYGFSFGVSARLSEYLERSLPVDILADVVNLEICEIVGFDSCLIDVLQVRASVNERICVISST
jgi:hypothetical protein